MIKKFLVSLLFFPLAVFAWEPTKPVTVIIGFGPGSLNETGFRAVAQQVQKVHPNFKYHIDLKPGADSVIAHNSLATASPDGYTIGIPSMLSLHVTNEIWQQESKKFQSESFTNVTSLGAIPMAIVANTSSKTNTTDELNRRLRDTATPITFGVGAGAHRMAWELIMDRAQGNRDLVKFTQFNGPVQAATSIASDAGIEFGVVPVSFAMPLVQAGKLKILGITTNKKLAAGEPYKINNNVISVVGEWVLVLPPNTPADIVKWYQTAFSTAVQTPEIQQFLSDNYSYVDLAHTTPAGLAKAAQDLKSTWLPMAPRLKAK